MLVVDIPSGYILEQYEANKLVRSRVVPEMRDVDTTQWGKTIWYFDRVPNETRCFEHTVRKQLTIKIKSCIWINFIILRKSAWPE